MASNLYLYFLLSMQGMIINDRETINPNEHIINKGIASLSNNSK